MLLGKWGIEPRPPALTGTFFTPEPPGKPQEITLSYLQNLSTLLSRAVVVPLGFLCSEAEFVLHFLHNHFLLPSHSVVSDCLQPHRLQPSRLLSPWDSPGKNTRVGCHFLLLISSY